MGRAPAPARLWEPCPSRVKNHRPEVSPKASTYPKCFSTAPELAYVTTKAITQSDGISTAPVATKAITELDCP